MDQVERTCYIWASDAEDALLGAEGGDITYETTENARTDLKERVWGSDTSKLRLFKVSIRAERVDPE